MGFNKERQQIEIKMLDTHYTNRTHKVEGSHAHKHATFEGSAGRAVSPLLVLVNLPTGPEWEEKRLSMEAFAANIRPPRTRHI